MIIQIIVDNPRSWIIPYAKELNQILLANGHSSELIHSYDDLKKGDILFLLSCEKIINAEKRNLHLNNIVVHESDLPKGKGWSPTTWQILEGKNEIPIVLLEAADKVDSGLIYLRSTFQLMGDELVDEIRAKQGIKTIELALEFIDKKDSIHPIQQMGEETYYPRRTAKDSELDVKKSIEDQFNLLRVCDNERYPAYFIMEGKKYLIKIEKI